MERLVPVDDGTNLENAEAITRAITRRIAERRRSEQAGAAQTATEKELTDAKLQPAARAGRAALPLQHAGQRAAADPQRPGRAPTQMLGHLIQYLRHSLPRTEDDAVHAGRGAGTRAAPTSRS